MEDERTNKGSMFDEMLQAFEQAEQLREAFQMTSTFLAQMQSIADISPSPLVTMNMMDNIVLKAREISEAARAGLLARAHQAHRSASPSAL